jgi:hypothetical protein
MMGVAESDGGLFAERCRITTSVFNIRNTGTKTIAMGVAKIAKTPMYERHRFAIGWIEPISSKTNAITAGAIIAVS